MLQKKKPLTSSGFLPRSLLVSIVCVLIIGNSVGMFIYRGIFEHSLAIHSDFNAFYAAGQLWAEGADVYDYSTYVERRIALAGNEPITDKYGFLYPPQAAAFFGLFAVLPINVAYALFMAFNVALAVICLSLLGRILAWFIPIRLLELTFLASLLNTSFAFINIRQVGLIAFTLILVSFMLVRRHKSAWAGVLFGLLSFKPTFLPIYLGGYAMRQNIRLLGACAISIVLCTSLPLVLSGRSLPATVQGWIANARTANNAADANDPSPFVPGSVRMLNLAPLAYRVFNSQSGLAQGLVWAILLALVGYTYALIWRSVPSEGGRLVDFALMSTLSLVVIYHRHYDVFLVFPGLCVVYIHMIRQDNPVKQRQWAVFLITILGMLAFPINILHVLPSKYPLLQSLYLWRVLAPLHSWAALGILGALLWLKTRQADVRLGWPIRRSTPDTSWYASSLKEY